MSVQYSCLRTHQKSALDLITDGCEPPCGCWELNSGLLEEEPLLLTSEPSLQPLVLVLLFYCLFVCFFKTGFLGIALAVLELTL